MMGESFNLYQDSDYQDLKNMMLHLYEEDPEGEPINERKVKNTINEFQKNPQKINIYIFKKSDEPIGYAILVYYWSNEYGGDILTIDELYVVKKYRGKGVATKFLSYTANFENVVALQLEVTPSNQRVLEYYKRLGFLTSQNTHLIKSLRK